MTQALAKLELLKGEFSRLAIGAGPQPAAKDAAQMPSRSAKPDAGRLVKLGLGVIAGFFGFLGTWAYFSPLESAAISYGVISAEGNRKAVQHLDGGIVRSIHIKEGELVQEGQELVRLDQVQALASLEIQSAAVEAHSAAIARLEAEAGFKDRIEFPGLLAQRRTEPSVAALLAAQEQLFEARRTALSAQVDTVGEQIKQSKAQIQIFRGQVETAENQYRMVQEELAPKEMLFEKGYATNSPVLQLKRTATALLGQKQEYTGHITRLEHLVGQLESQISQAQSDFQLKVAQELADTRNKLAEAKERERVARDILDRTVIRAPATGRVLGLAVNTLGAVIAKGERLLEIVPEDVGFVIKARFKPSEGIEIHEGMKAELRFLSSHGRKMPLIFGVVRTRSADARADLATESTFFDVDVVVPADELKTLEAAKPSPGTPVEVIIPTGSRTVLAYMLEPISESLRHGLREK